MIQPVVDIDFPPETPDDAAATLAQMRFLRQGGGRQAQVQVKYLGGKKKTPSRAWGSRLAIWGDGGGIAKSSRVQRRPPVSVPAVFKDSQKYFVGATRRNLLELGSMFSRFDGKSTRR
jgi:hypothetical protein